MVSNRVLSDLNSVPFLLPRVGDPGVKEHASGTHRLITPTRTLARIRPFLSAMEITRVANITGLDRIGIPVTVVCRPNARGLAVAQGKGLTLDAAKASGVMESIESYHAERVNLPIRQASYAELQQTSRVVNIDLLPHTPGGRLQPNMRILWIEGYELMERGPVWVPYELVHTDYTIPFLSGETVFQATSNGLASGNHLLEAVSHAICEIVERDGFGLWRARSEAARLSTRVDPDSVDDADCRHILDRYRDRGLECAVWDITSDIALPTYRCSIAERSDDPLRPMFGADGTGCHPAPEIALLRALLEAAQCRLTYIAGSRDDIFRNTYARSLNWDVALREREALFAGAGLPVDFRARRRVNGATFYQDVEAELECLRRVGIREVIVVDLTNPTFEIPVVRVIIPGLEGVCSRPDYVPGLRAQRVRENS